MAQIRFVLMEGESEDLHGLLDRLALSAAGALGSGSGGVRVVIDGGAAGAAPKALPAAVAKSAKSAKPAKRKGAAVT